MKTVILSALICLGASAMAYTVDYGPGAYTKTVRVCDKNDSGNEVNCGNRTYKFFKPRLETHCMKNDSGGSETCFKAMVTGNWGSIKFKNRKEADEYYRQMGKSGN